MTAPGWLTMTLALALVWPATAWRFRTVPSRLQPEATRERATAEVEHG